ncbi:TfuA-like protein [Dactylosporangium sp. NPDC005555]|uniref:TfuA-like protein n=1 Tax=Dactylosporangium sp. NPDC005555 TaxID=3154889 RepID=UPI0033B231FD
MIVTVFAGPTIDQHTIRTHLPDAQVHPPIRHGDLYRLNCAAGDVVVIIDGVFHQSAPVRHKEILELLAAGTTVIGVSSMGALRAAELHRYGMIGIGEVFAAYADGTIDADDEVAVIHTPDDHRQLSEALVNVRATLAAATQDHVLDRGHADRLLGLARAMPYPQRTWPALARAATAEPDLTDAIRRITDWRHTHPAAGNVKRDDAISALAWVAAGCPNLPAADLSWTTQPWRTSYTRHWRSRYCLVPAGDSYVPFLAVLQHQQLYDPVFPARWRRYVLTWIAGQTPPPATDTALDAAALAAAAQHGLTADTLTPDQRSHWLTPTELLSLCNDDALLRIVVRSARLDAAAAIWPTSLDEARDLIEPGRHSPRHIAAAFATNAAAVAADPRRTVHRIRADLIRVHLAAVWGITPTHAAELDAAARDRGFDGLGGAITVARSFYLRAATVSPSVPAGAVTG